MKFIWKQSMNCDWTVQFLSQGCRRSCKKVYFCGKGKLVNVRHRKRREKKKKLLTRKRETGLNHDWRSAGFMFTTIFGFDRKCFSSEKMCVCVHSCNPYGFILLFSNKKRGRQKMWIKISHPPNPRVSICIGVWIYATRRGFSPIVTLVPHIFGIISFLFMILMN